MNLEMKKVDLYLLRVYWKGKKVTLGNVYFPNTGQVKFSQDTLELLNGFTGDSVIIGDFNLTLNPTLDTSTSHNHLSFAAHKKIRNCLFEHQLLDIWRIMHPNTKGYTFFSQVHSTYTQIYLFLKQHNDFELFTE